MRFPRVSERVWDQAQELDMDLGGSMVSVVAALGADGGGGRGSSDLESVGMRQVDEKLAAGEACTATSV